MQTRPNLWAFFQAKNVRRTSTILAKDDLELRLAAEGANWSPEVRQRYEQRIAAYDQEIDRYRTEPEEGTIDLANRAREIEAKLDRALKQDPNFDLAEGLFQIGIVVASVAILTKTRPLMLGAGLLGLIAAVLMANGLFLFMELPF